ncbi:hypothetical protein ACET98_23330 [Aeromonas veronii]
MDNKLLIHVGKTSDAVNTLVKLKHTESALILLYSWIDRMAWLSVPNEESSGGDFKRWVEIYLLEETSLPCTSDDLWSARCALLHTGSSESRDTAKGNARTVLYYGGDEADFTSNEDDKVFLKISDLHCGLISAITRFNEHLNENPSEKAIADKKLGKMLARTELVAG